MRKAPLDIFIAALETSRSPYNTINAILILLKMLETWDQKMASMVALVVFLTASEISKKPLTTT